MNKYDIEQFNIYFYKIDKIKEIKILIKYHLFCLIFELKQLVRYVFSVNTVTLKCLNIYSDYVSILFKNCKNLNYANIIRKILIGIRVNENINIPIIHFSYC